MRAGILIGAFIAACATPAQAATAPVIVEVYTSQGCGPCVEANGLVEKLAEQDGRLPLTFSVDYWDYLGWRDTFARPEFAERQRAYAARMARAGVYTPQVVIDGDSQAKATEPERVEHLIRKAAHEPRDPPQIRYIGARVAVGSGQAPGGEADVWLIRYDPRGREVEVTKGDNRGKTITYRNVVRELVRLGGWKGRPSSFRVPEATDAGLETIVVVQQADGGPVLALLGE